MLTHATLHVNKIWTDFEEIYNLATDPNGYPPKVFVPKSWINSFWSLCGK